MPRKPPEPSAIFACSDVPAGAQRVRIRIEERQHALLLIIVQQELPGRRDGDRDRHRRSEAIQRQDSPARKSRSAPPTTSSVAVPRLGCISTSTAGARIIRSGAKRRSGRETSSGPSPCRIARQRQHERDLHRFRRLQRERAQFEPALRAHADCARKSRQRQEARGPPHKRGRQFPSKPAGPRRRSRAEEQGQRRTGRFAVPPRATCLRPRPNRARQNRTQAMRAIRTTSVHWMSASLCVSGTTR